jgi:hypothetical protein
MVRVPGDSTPVTVTFRPANRVGVSWSLVNDARENARDANEMDALNRKVAEIVR